MYAYSHDGVRIVDIYMDGMVVDADGRKLPIGAVVVVDGPLVADAGETETPILKELPADQVEAARNAYEDWFAEEERNELRLSKPTTRTYVLDLPESGLRSLDSFDVEERRKLRPVAETLAMLDGNAFFGMTTDEDGDDTHYLNYIPEAAALVESNGGWSSLASFIRGAETLPENPMGLVMERTVDGRPVIDLVDRPDRILDLSDIDWDLSDDDPRADGLAPVVPTDLLVGVDERAGEEADGYDGLADLLSDRYGFCVNAIGGVESVDKPVGA